MVPQIDTLKELETADKSYQVYCKETDAYYIWNEQNNNWTEINNDATLSFSIYDMNKQIISQLPSLTPEETKEKLAEAISKFNEKDKTYMLLFKEMEYYTLFISDFIFARRKDTFYYNENLSDSIAECLIDVAQEVKVIDECTMPGLLEIWIKNYNDEQNEALSNLEIKSKYSKISTKAKYGW